MISLMQELYNSSEKLKRLIDCIRNLKFLKKLLKSAKSLPKLRVFLLWKFLRVKRK